MSEAFSIRQAKKSELIHIVNFLKAHWKENHIFTECPELLEWQHIDPQNLNDLTFMIAGHLEPNSNFEIFGLLGFIPNHRFDKLSTFTSLALAIWKVADNCKVPGLGLQLLKELTRTYKPDAILAIGISEMVKPIYKILGYKIGIMEHRALFSEREKANKMFARNVPNLARRKAIKYEDVTLDEIDGENVIKNEITQITDLKNSNRLIFKGFDFVKNRYLKHPWYKYRFFSIKRNQKPRCMLIVRKIQIGQGNILRTVDILGDFGVLQKAGHVLRLKLDESNCDYIDIVYSGIEKVNLDRCGFISKKEFPDLLLPNYFAPLVNKNVELAYAYKVFLESEKKMVLMRGDSDQDRPNLVSELNVNSMRISQ